MNERPILFQGAMVRAILRGTKTQTRRAVKLDTIPQHAEFSDWQDHRGRTAAMFSWPGEERDQQGRVTSTIRGGLCCPYGQPGDRLWVRENGWQRPERTPKMMREGADTWEPYYFDADILHAQEHAELKEWGFKRRPSIHMPRAFSRILLEITAVRVERLQAISEADAVAEGCLGGQGSIPGYNYSATPCEQYRRLWQQINGAGSWDANPWVWVVEFRRSQP